MPVRDGEICKHNSSNACKHDTSSKHPNAGIGDVLVHLLKGNLWEELLSSLQDSSAGLSWWSERQKETAFGLCGLDFIDSEKLFIDTSASYLLMICCKLQA